MKPISTFKNYIYPFLIVLPIGAALLNTNLFGVQSLTSYFGITFFASLCSIVLCVQCVRNNIYLSQPVFITILLLFLVYVFAHGFILHNLNLTHYYWLVAGLWLFSTHAYLSKVNQQNIFVYKIIVFISVCEALVVIAQWCGLVNSKNELFRCTGTWVNPNVTALFLSLSVLSLTRISQQKNGLNRWHVIMTIVILAIIMLQCRTAYLVLIIFLASNLYRSRFITFGITKRNIAGFLSLSLLISLIGTTIFSTGTFKHASTQARIAIWKNCMVMFKQNPLFGYGFGTFEREYNLYAASHHLQGNDHINMPYNDFIELAVEGGVIAVILWSLFYIFLFIHFRRHKKPLELLFAFIIIQLTNFGFQAIPAFALFILLVTIESIDCIKVSRLQEVQTKVPSKIHSLARVYLLMLSLFILLTSTLFYTEAVYAAAFYKRNTVSKINAASNIITSYSELENILGQFPGYQESYGDAYCSIKKTKPALQHYLAATKHSSNPNLLLKTGYCYQLSQQYDSSIYFFTLVQNMQPYHLTPRMALLKMYEQKKDTLNMVRKAQEILNMEVKVENEKTSSMKAYARSIIDQKNISF